MEEAEAAKGARVALRLREAAHGQRPRLAHEGLVHARDDRKQLVARHALLSSKGVVWWEGSGGWRGGQSTVRGKHAL